MKIIVVYATYSSGTQTAAEFLGKTLTTFGHTVVLTRANEAKVKDFSTYDLIIMGSPSWWVDGMQGQPHEHFKPLLEELKMTRVAHKDFAIFGLGHSDYYMQFCGAVPILEEAVKNAGGKLKVESLKIDAFYFNLDESEKLLKQWAKDIS